MAENKIQAFRDKCTIYLSGLGIGDLRSYGREIGVARPTTKNKEELVSTIVKILSGELMPIEISKQGAPVKSWRVDETIHATINEIKREYFTNDIMQEIPDYDFKAEYAKMQSNKETICVREHDDVEKREGQLQLVEGEYQLLRKDATPFAEKILLSETLVQECGLCEGDLLLCYVKLQEAESKVTRILSVNGGATIPSVRFDQKTATPSTSRLSVYDGRGNAALKFIDWLAPLSKGHRAGVISAPKAGKTRLLLQIAKAASRLNKGLETLVLLVEQAPELLWEYHEAMGADRLFTTTYADEPERQVLVAEFVLNRAKRLAESGKDVLLLVDSLSALARAFNDTEASVGGKTLACGLEIKTVRYIKKYFATARSLEGGGSLTILGAVNEGTGNPMDDVLRLELSSQMNYELVLNNDLAIRRVYPALDLSTTSVKGSELYRTGEEEEVELFLRNKALPILGAQEIVRLLGETDTKEVFLRKIEDAIKNN